MKIIWVLLSVIVAFVAGYLAGNFTARGTGSENIQENSDDAGRRATSIGGIFFKSENPDRLKECMPGILGWE